MSIKIYGVELNRIILRKGRRSIPSIGLNAEYAKSVTSTEEYANSIDGVVSYTSPSNVTIDTNDVDTINGFTKSIRFLGGSDIHFPINNPLLYNKRFYFKCRIKISRNDNAFVVYFHQEPNSTNFSDRLLIGNGSLTDQNLNLWNNAQNPKIWYDTDITGDWKTLEFYYNGSDTFEAYVNGTQIYSETYTILSYTNWYDWIRVVVGADVRLSYYEVQIEGVNWDNPTVGNAEI